MQYRQLHSVAHYLLVLTSLAKSHHCGTSRRRPAHESVRSRRRLPHPMRFRPSRIVAPLAGPGGGVPCTGGCSSSGSTGGAAPGPLCTKFGLLLLLSRRAPSAPTVPCISGRLATAHTSALARLRPRSAGLARDGGVSPGVGATSALPESARSASGVGGRVRSMHASVRTKLRWLVARTPRAGGDLAGGRGKSHGNAHFWGCCNRAAIR